jgi:hypothetical protein
MGRVAEGAWRRLQRRLLVAEPERARNRGKKPKELEELLLAADPTVGRGLRRVQVD